MLSQGDLWSGKEEDSQGLPASTLRAPGGLVEVTLG